MDSNSKDKRSSSARVPILGKHNFDAWRKRFFAHLTVLGCEDAINASHELPEDPKNIPEARKDELKKNIKANNMAVAALTLAFTHAEHLEFVDDSATEAYPQGIASIIMSKLMRRINPDDDIVKVEAEIELAKLHFSPKTNPDHFFTKLTVIKSRYKSSRKFTEDELIINVMSKIPEDYTSTVLAEQRRRGNKLQLIDIQDAMKAQWRMTANKSRMKKSSNRQEVTLLSYDRYSHKNINKSYPNNNRFVGKKKTRANIICNTCGKRGHKSKDCWLDPKKC